MYETEKMINGILHSRKSIGSPWIPKTQPELRVELVTEKGKVGALKRKIEELENKKKELEMDLSVSRMRLSVIEVEYKNVHAVLAPPRYLVIMGPRYGVIV